MFSDCVAAAAGARREVSVLAEYFAAQVAAQNSWRTKHFSAEALDILKHYAWPGNVRELRNVRRASPPAFERRNQSPAGEVEMALPAVRNGPVRACRGKRHAGHRIESFEREVLLTETAPPSSPHDQTWRARWASKRSHLYKKCQQLGIDVASERKSD